MTKETPIIDAQVHAYERDHPGRPWKAVLHGPSEVTGGDMVAAMDAVGVHGALLVSPWTMYRYDASYAVDVHRDHPDRFGLIKPVDPHDPGVGDTVDEWAETPGAVGARLMLVGKGAPQPDGAGVRTVLAAGARNGLPINILCWGRVSIIDELARRHPETTIVVDHLGLPQPFEPPAPPDPWRDLDDVLALATHENVAIKVTGACTLSHQPFPFDDLWPHLERLVEVFGVDRLLWGTDWTRAVELLTYREGVDAFRSSDRLSDAERAALMGGTLSRIYRWSPGPTAPDHGGTA
ncbi:MAG: amidohydrolase family protein [Actinomycetota bacterium]